jgi:hypothetical protein
MPQNTLIGAAGEHLVLSNILKRGIIANQTPKNTEGFDILTLNVDGTPSPPIQVKTTMNKNGWIMEEKHEIPIENLIFCFVYLENNHNSSEIFVIDSKKVAYIIKNHHKIWLKLPGRNGQPHNPTKMRKLFRNPFGRMRNNFEDYLTEEDLNFINEHSNGWIDQHKDTWHAFN